MGVEYYLLLEGSYRPNDYHLSTTVYIDKLSEKTKEINRWISQNKSRTIAIKRLEHKKADLDTNIINDLGWKPNTDLRSGLIKTYDWAIKNKIFE